jgi:hypothetical protein
MEATRALAVMGPMPGTFASLQLVSLARWHTWICTSSSRTWRSSSFRCSIRRWITSRDDPVNSLVASSSSSGARRAMLEIPYGTTSPNSVRRPRIWLACAVPARTKPCRTRCSESTDCCSTFLIGTKRILGCATASQIASASAASFLLVLTYGLTNCGLQYLLPCSFTPWTEKMFFAKSMPTVVIFMMGASLGKVVASTLRLWHIDAVSGRGVHSIPLDLTLTSPFC